MTFSRTAHAVFAKTIGKLLHAGRGDAVVVGIVRAGAPLLATAAMCVQQAAGAPTITGLNPSSAAPSAIVTVSGTGFGFDPAVVSVDLVQPAPASAPIISVDDDAVAFMVPQVAARTYTLTVTVGADTSNEVFFTVAEPPDIPDPMGTITGFLDDLDTIAATLPAVDPGSPLCSFPPGGSALNNLDACLTTLAGMAGSPPSANDMITTLDVMRGLLPSAVAELSSAQQTQLAQVLQTSGLVSAVDAVANELTGGGLRSMSLSLRCKLDSIQGGLDVASMVASIIGAVGAVAPPANVVIDVASNVLSAASCLINFVVHELENAFIAPGSISLSGPGGSSWCRTVLQLRGQFTNGCPCECIFSVVGVPIVIPIGEIVAIIDLEPGDAEWDDGGGPIAPDPEYPALRATDGDQATLTGEVTCLPNTSIATATIWIGPETCDGQDNDCDGAVDEDLPCCGVDCDDFNACTMDVCVPLGTTDFRCDHIPLDVLCGDTGNPCTKFVCNQTTGECDQEVPINEGQPCDDGKGCTLDDKCVQGACTGTPKNCPPPDECHQGVCNEPDGVCGTGATFSCQGDDGDPCTEDLTSCDPVRGCNPPIEECISGDGCCPQGCELIDTDCPADDCNSNSVPDPAEYTGGSATDCDSSGVLDECESTCDCNRNGTNDICDLAADPSLDANSDGELDACGRSGCDGFEAANGYGVGPLAGQQGWIATDTFWVAPGNALAGVNAVKVTLDPGQPVGPDSLLAIGPRKSVNDTGGTVGALWSLNVLVSNTAGPDFDFALQDTCDNTGWILGEVKFSFTGGIWLFDPIQTMFLPTAATYTPGVYHNLKMLVLHDANVMEVYLDNAFLGSVPTLPGTRAAEIVLISDNFPSGVGADEAFVDEICVTPLSDCNANGGPDACDISCADLDGVCAVRGSCATSLDANTNGAPDECDPAPTCTTDSDCDDGDACNGVETCDLATGICQPGTPPDCDDGNPCTDDSCDPGLGCQQLNNSLPCNDSDACTTNDTCSNGTCAGGPPVNCDDADPCTDDSCDPGLGCQYVNNSLPCNDSDACTANDTCSNGTCVGGPPVDCDDANPCTVDSCDAVLGCQHANSPVGAPCGDQSILPCDNPDTCDGLGTCLLNWEPAGTPCSDGILCNGDEICLSFTCGSVSEPCPGQWCDAAIDACVAFGDGDFDGDSRLDLRDFAAFQRCFGAVAGPACYPANLSGDGLVDQEDYLEFGAHFTGP